MSDQAMPEQDVTEVNYSFGQRLSSARRALNLTPEKVAAELRLNVSLIQALEEEDYINLPTQMYIAGYLRNYARLLKIPVEPLLIALDKAKLESPLLVNDVTRPGKTSHSKLVVKSFVLVLLVVVVTGVVSWVQVQDFAIFSAKTVVGEKIEVAEQNETSVVVAKVLPVNETKPSELETQDVPVDDLAKTAVVEKTPEAKAVVEEAEVVSVPEVVVEVVKTEQVKDGVKLTLVFSDDCWAEVKDSRGDTLVYDLYRDGQVKQISGMPPFNIFLGNAPAVEIEYNDLAYDASEHIRGKLARFKLGRAEDYESIVE